jgi:pimeloyl-ACP methyl ester carboxylesterase
VATGSIDEAWRAAGRTVPAGDHAVFVRDEPAAEPDAGLPPLLVLHGFPTCGLDYRDCLATLAARRRVVIPDHLGHGLSDKPDRRYGIRMLADAIEGAVAALGLDEVDLLTHDIGDSVGGELLARDLEGTLGFRVRRRVLTNGSIYMDLVQLSAGQQLLLSLPDEATDLITEEAWIGGVRGTFAPGAAVPDEELAALWRLNTHADGQRLLPRTIRYIEDRRAEERRYTEPIERHPSPLGVIWGRLDPIAVHAMAERLVATRPGTPLVTLDDVGHYPMLEAPARFADAVVRLLEEP